LPLLAALHPAPLLCPSLPTRRSSDLGRSRAETRAHFGLPPDGRIALLSFGGYGLPTLDLSTLDCSDDWTIVTTDRVMRDGRALPDRKSTRLNSSHVKISYAVFCLKKK